MAYIKTILLAVLLTSLTVWTYFILKKILSQSIENIRKVHQRLTHEYSALRFQNSGLKQHNADLEKKLEKTIALYDVAREICKYLEEDKVFSVFNEQIKQHIELKDCLFLKDDTQLNLYKDYTVLPLQIDKTNLGYLLADGIKEEDADTFQILAQQFQLAVKRAALYQKLQELAITDSLTQVLSRRYWRERFQEELARSKRLKYNLSCLMLDVDHFKEYNDRFGHLVGDAILREVSKCIKDNIREIDIMGRYGGEEFCLVLTETNKQKAIAVAQRICQAVQQKNIKAYDEELKITISIGISTYPADASDIQTLVDNADQALYQAKGTGRNKVCVFGVK